MIVLLLNCFISYCQDNVPSTGKDSVAIVPINYIRIANERLIEREYLLEMTAQQDSLINDYKGYVAEQKKVITLFEDRITESAKLNDSLRKNLKRSKTCNLVFGGIALSAIFTTVIIAIAN